MHRKNSLFQWLLGDTMHGITVWHDRKSFPCRWLLDIMVTLHVVDVLGKIVETKSIRGNKKDGGKMVRGISRNTN